ncbi:hypothetical protein PTMSG1_09824 [Pyrenophora teres f. maculata]|nr:hypothetical protein PTMSG1_09824 [Pyrenophora teres f. maculata]
MLSTQNKLRLFLGLVLTVIFAASSQELRIAVGFLFSWALGLVLQRRFALPAGFRKAHNTYMFVSFWLLAVFNNPFYENTFGRLLDVFFKRDRFDPDVPGSGFTDWHETYRRRHKDEIDSFRQSLQDTIFWTLLAVFLVIFVLLWHWVDDTYTKSTEISRTITYLSKHGVPPPLRHKQPEPSVSKRDTRYNRLSDELIFVCGPSGGLETVIDGDVEGAIARRRQLRPRYA